MPNLYLNSIKEFPMSCVDACISRKNLSRIANVSFGFVVGIALTACSNERSQPPQSDHLLRSVKGVVFHGEAVTAEEMILKKLKSQNRLADTPEEAATKEPNWFTMDPSLNNLEGVSADRAYSELGLKIGVEPIIVAVIDSGVDIEHEDLKDRLWVNNGEIPDNKIDDDKNGFVDDINGWNFLGSVDSKGNPTFVHDTTLEVTRELVRMKKLKADREAAGLGLTPEEESYLNEVETHVTTEREGAIKALAKYLEIRSQLQTYYDLLKSLIEVPFEAVTLDMLKKLIPKDPSHIEAKEKMIALMINNRISSTARLLRVINAVSDSANYHHNENFDPRKEIIGDDLNDFDDINYGNNVVEGPDAFHGTHVSGIIAANRDNTIGARGIAQDVRIMALRAVPNGDEYDKDVANAVRYATNNGARVINMSFGKAYSSTNKSKVDAAFAYAASKGVVIVHSAGNDGKLNTPFNNFPNKYVKSSPGAVISNWIEVGASGAVKGERLPAFFSNFGKETVDVFAPGYFVFSSIPGNLYQFASGTSMAGPCVAGVAAVIFSQHSTASGTVVRDAIRQTARVYPGLIVQLPTEDGQVSLGLFNTLSSTGGIADVYAALRNFFLLSPSR